MRQHHNAELRMMFHWDALPPKCWRVADDFSGWPLPPISKISADIRSIAPAPTRHARHALTRVHDQETMKEVGVLGGIYMEQTRNNTH